MKERNRRIKRLQYQSMLKGAVLMLTVTLIASKSNKLPKKASAYEYKETLSQEEVMEQERRLYNIENGEYVPAFMYESKMKEMGVEEGDLIEIQGQGVFIVRNRTELREDAVILLDSTVEEGTAIYKYYR